MTAIPTPILSDAQIQWESTGFGIFITVTLGAIGYFLKWLLEMRKRYKNDNREDMIADEKANSEAESERIKSKREQDKYEDERIKAACEIVLARISDEAKRAIAETESLRNAMVQASAKWASEKESYIRDIGTKDIEIAKCKVQSEWLQKEVERLNCEAKLKRDEEEGGVP